MDQLTEGKEPPAHVPSPERPGGHIRVNVSQPELLYTLAQIPVRENRIVEKDVVSLTPIFDIFLEGESTNFYRSEPIKGYSYNTNIGVQPSEKDKHHQGYYTPNRTTTVLEWLKMQGAIVNMDTIVNGQQRLKIYHPSGAYGLEVFLGWPSRADRAQYLTSTALKYGSEKARQSPDELTQKERDEIQMYLAEPQNIAINLANRRRLDTDEGWDTYVPIPATQAEFLMQTEFYRKTLEQVLRTLYSEAQVIPNVDITLRPPNVSGDTLDQIASVTGETVQPITEQQLRSERVTLDDIKGQPEAVREARRLVRAINQPELYEKRGMKPPKGVLFVGPPGTGKTMLAKGIATEANADFVSINAVNVGSKWINESARLMNDVFDDAERRVAEGRKVIIFIDEIDAIASRRDTDRMHIEDVKTISILLQRLDGVMTKPGVTLLATTNREGAIDPAILRPGRIDKIIPIELPNQEGRKEIVQSYVDKAKAKADPQFKDSLFSPNLDLNTVAAQTDGLSGAELENLVNRALENNMDLELEGQGWNPITADQLLQAIPSVKTETEQRKRYIGFVQPR